ncbi:hypothetical protein [Nostoc sp.]|uniref:hypothetical protein n=1 Tax=Nostoc sp. TaxID=1180 RepID=UPI002FF7146F
MFLDDVSALLNHGMISPNLERIFNGFNQKLIPHLCNADISSYRIDTKYVIEDVGGRGQFLLEENCPGGGAAPAPLCNSCDHYGLGFKTRTPNFLVLWLFFRRGLSYKVAPLGETPRPHFALNPISEKISCLLPPSITKKNV